ncbi:DNA-directed RNA polymerase subunit beta [Ureibacillus acetophenoni]|uniref:DNA-directed RNA polymerase subunit beta n=1 Tax=Ureibacillus acetophenoni TaxID=614649 RepID=A0A285U3C5_9BACL|nr:DNA-directed RNA polymerase subunit beta [Ureibacillus acetophenoni]SOC34751.1 DNA-directed RNA polymerase subunit beta [Ureibacillus acetophenoni]
MTNELINDNSNPREDLSQLKKTSRRRMRREESKQKKEVKQPQTTKEILFSRLLATAIKVIVFFAVLLFVAIAGLMIGYGVIGEGNPVDALNWDTWQHMLDIINGKE